MLIQGIKCNVCGTINALDSLETTAAMPIGNTKVWTGPAYELECIICGTTRTYRGSDVTVEEVDSVLTNEDFLRGQQRFRPVPLCPACKEPMGKAAGKPDQYTTDGRGFDCHNIDCQLYSLPPGIGGPFAL